MLPSLRSRLFARARCSFAALLRGTNVGCAPQVEQLEGRRMLTNYAYAGPGWANESDELFSNANVWRENNDRAYSDTLTVSYTVTGDAATKGVDYKLDDGTVTLNPGETNVEIPYTWFNDDEPEDEETIVVTVTLFWFSPNWTSDRHGL